MNEKPYVTSSGVEYRQGRCRPCNVVYYWPGNLGPLKAAHCPKCGEKLSATTRLHKLPTQVLERFPRHEPFR